MRDHYVQRWDGRCGTVDAICQALQRSFRDLTLVGDHGGQGRVGVLSVLDAVEPHHGDVLGDTDALLVGDVEGAEGEFVTERKDGVGTCAFLEKSRHGRGTVCAMQGGHRFLQAGVLWQAGTPQCLVIAGQALPCRFVVHVGLQADRGDASAPGLDQMARGFVSGKDVVDGDAVGQPMGRLLAQEDDRYVAGAVFQLTWTQRPRTDDKSVDQAVTGAFQEAFFCLGVAEGLVDGNGP